MRIVSWNVNGLRAVAGKGLAAWLAASGADLLLVQETKVDHLALPDALAEIDGYRLRLLPATRRGYSGVGIYFRDEPDEWIEGIGNPEFDDEGRLLIARYGRVLVGSVYFPNSQAAGARLDYRLAFADGLHAFLKRQRRRGRRAILGGDFNVAHREIDLARPRQNVRNPGFLPQERGWMDDFLAAGFVDSWRRQHPAEVGYSWWSYRHEARKKGIGWRLDYVCVDQLLWSAVVSTAILAEVEGSDHCPISLEFDERSCR